MRYLIAFTRVVDAISERMGQLAMYITILTIIVGFYNVVARYLGRFIEVKLSSNFFIELQWYLYTLVFFFGFAYIMKHGINVRVDFFYGQWSNKRKAMLDFWGHLLLLTPFLILALYVTIDPVLRSWGRLPNGTWGPWEMSPDPSGLPRAPIKSMILVAFFTLLLQTVAELIKMYAVITDREDILEQVRPYIIEEIEREEPLRIE
ncbi:MAG: TRAP transporter small permease subunit [Ardenticatenia bacterium]|nr:TRAP transporter small permease subunit [Ardenticatenia bacterium]